MDFVQDRLPAPMGTMEELLADGDTHQTELKIFVGHNLGYRTYTASVPMHKFYGMSEVANPRAVPGEQVAQRKLDKTHAKKLAVYILKGLVTSAIKYKEAKGEVVSETLLRLQEIVGKQPYMSLQPLVVCLRTCESNGKNIPAQRLITDTGETASFKVFLSQKDILWVIDGQHRREAMNEVFSFIADVCKYHRYPPRKQSIFPYNGERDVPADDVAAWNECASVARSFCTVQLEVHLGLDVEEERQLFMDMNYYGKKIEKGLALEFDNSNPINLFIKDDLPSVIDFDILSTDVVNWTNDTPGIARKHIAAINGLLFMNKSNINGAAPSIVNEKKDIALHFWECVNYIDGLSEEGPRLKTVAAQPVVLKAMAKLVYDFAFGRKKDEELLEKMLNGISSIDFSHSNPMWRYYELSSDERAEFSLEGLSSYLPSDDEGYNRDIGGYDSKMEVMRFGAKHNDIFPIIGDMIRYSLGLPSRHA